MDDVLCDFTKSYRAALRRDPKTKYPQSTADFFAKLPPITGAIDGVNALRNRPGFDVYVLTAPSTRNPCCYTEKRIWIENHFDYPFTKKLIISPNKGLLKGDILIDDRVDGKGQENFEGQIIHFGSKQFPDWDAVLRHFEILL